METGVRATITTLDGLVVLMTVSALAAPLAPTRSNSVELGSASPIELVRQGCGWGRHCAHWCGR